MWTPWQAFLIRQAYLGLNLWWGPYFVGLDIWINFITTFLEKALGMLTLVRILCLHQLLSAFPGSHLQAPEQVGFKVEGVALISTRIWQGFPLIFILVSSWLFKGITSSSLPVNHSESHQPWEGPTWSGYGHLSWCGRVWQNFLRQFFLPVSCLIANDTLISGTGIC